MKLPHKILMALLLIAAGCSQSKDHAMAISLQAGLKTSNQIIMGFTDRSLYRLEKDLAEPYTQGKADGWAPSLRQLKKMADTCVTHIDNLSTGQAKIDNQLSDLFTAYKKTMQTIIPDMPLHADSLLDELDRTNDAYLKQAVLCKLKNVLVTSEYNTVRYCEQRIVIDKPVFCEFLPTAMISNTRVRRGDTIQLSAWVGGIYTHIDLELTARNITVRDTINGPLEYKFIANDPPGTYSLPIQMHYSKPDGSTATIQKTFKYTILP